MADLFRASVISFFGWSELVIIESELWCEFERAACNTASRNISRSVGLLGSEANASMFTERSGRWLWSFISLCHEENLLNVVRYKIQIRVRLA